MQVTFHGVRGSIPTPGPSTVRYGGNTSCVEVVLNDGTTLILDAGTGMRSLGRKLVLDGRADGPLHLVITHAHWDHIIGLPFFSPVYRPTATLVLHPLFMERPGHVLSFEELFDGQHFPLRIHQLPSTLVRPPPIEAAWRIGSATVTRTVLNHPGGSTGFRVEDADGRVLVFLTDNELVPPGPRRISTAELARFAHRCDLLVHDSQYLEADLPQKLGWGHSTVAQVLELGQRAEARQLALYHHDPDRHDDALDVIGREARAAYKGGDVVVAHEGLTITL